MFLFHHHLMTSQCLLLRQQQQRMLRQLRRANFTMFCIDCLDEKAVNESVLKDFDRQRMDLPKPAHLYQLNQDGYKSRWQEISFSEMLADFDRLYINHSDANVVDFMRRMRPLLTSSRIDLVLSHERPPHNRPVEVEKREKICVPATMTALGQLLPMIECPEKLYVTSLKELLILRDHFPDKFYGIKKLEYRVEDEWNEQSVELIWDWLCAPPPPNREGGEPKLLKFQVFGCWVLTDMREQFKERFSNATQMGPPFSIDIWLPREDDAPGLYGEDEEVEGDGMTEIVENVTTGERLSLEMCWATTHIRRFHPGLKEEEEEEITNDKASGTEKPAMTDNKQRQIFLLCPAMTWQEEQQCREEFRREIQASINKIKEKLERKTAEKQMSKNSSSSIKCSWSNHDQQIRALENDNHRLQAELVEARLANVELEKAKRVETASLKAELDKLKKLLNAQATTQGGQD